MGEFYQNYNFKVYSIAYNARTFIYCLEYFYIYLKQNTPLFMDKAKLYKTVELLSIIINIHVNVVDI